jgi:hypothetical protein
MRWSGVCTVLWVCGTPSLSGQTPEAWHIAARRIHRLAPDSFPQLPPLVRSALKVRDCRVPQSFTSERPHNVVTGSFARAGQQDWAVLCSRQDSSSVLIFWGGADAESPTEFPRAADAGYLQGVGEGRIGYSRLIAAASPARIREYAAWFDGPLPKTLDHDGVEDAFAGKASVVSYLEDGRWLALAGAD